MFNQNTLKNKRRAAFVKRSNAVGDSPSNVCLQFSVFNALFAWHVVFIERQDVISCSREIILGSLTSKPTSGCHRPVALLVPDAHNSARDSPAIVCIALPT